MRPLLRSLVVVALLAAPALARPGGGQHYSAPSHSYSSPSYSSHSYSSPSYGYTPSDSSSSGSAFPTLMLIIVVTVIVLAVIAARRRRGQRATVAADDGARERGIAALRAQDPGFDPAAFAERAARTMAEVNRAWCEGSMAPARKLVSDGVFVRFQTQLKLLAQDGLKNVMSDWRITAAEVVAAEADASWDTVHVKLAAQARDADVPTSADAAHQQRALSGKPVQPYEEVWSFIRRRGKRSSAAGALEGKCASCGAPVPPSESVRCEYCQAILNSGDHDWVLAEITQPEEWRPQLTDAPLDGLEQLRGRDPMISRQELEDRASVVFWKWIAARTTGDRRLLQRFAVKPLDDAHAQNLWLLPPVRLHQVAIGSSELVQVQPSGDDGLDRAWVRIYWSAATDGQPPQGMGLVMAIARSSQAQSRRGVSSLDCPNCGGALAESDDVVCRYCGEALGVQKGDWALDHLSQAN